MRIALALLLLAGCVHSFAPNTPPISIQLGTVNGTPIVGSISTGPVSGTPPACFEPFTVTLTGFQDPCACQIGPGAFQCTCPFPLSEPSVSTCQ